MYNVHGWHSEYMFADTLEGIGCDGNPDDIKDVEIMQFTGLLDKNGKEIYEGDVIKYKNSIESGEGTICFSAGFTIEWNLSTVKSSKPSIISPLFYFQCSEELEVIGNIYQDKNLIK